MNQIWTGEQSLLKQAEVGFPKGITKICENVYFFLGYGGSTCTLVIGEESCLLIDCLNGMAVAKEALKEIEKLTDKPITHIVYTHYHHFDHTSGAKVFANEDTTIIGRKPTYPQYGKGGLLKDIYGIRGARQFGVGLTQEESISVGIGPYNQINNEKGPLPCTELFSEDVVHLDLNGIQVMLSAAPGETDDHLYVWLPQYKVLCCGDNYYESWPNLYAIRGGQYRDVSSWIDSLRTMANHHPYALLPGHTRAVVGKDVVAEVLKNFSGALEYVLVSTLEGMNQGKTPEELVETVVLPPEYASLPYLQEYYGTVAWSVRAIYQGYLGWFDGNPTSLGFMPQKDRATKTLTLMGGGSKVLAAAQDALAQGDAQWGAELCDILLQGEEEVAGAKACKAGCLTHLGRMTISANGRHYYLVCAKQLEGNGKVEQLQGATTDAARGDRG